MNTMNTLPFTYFDVLKKRHPELFEYVNKEIFILRQKGSITPLTSTEKLQYCDEYIKTVISYFKNYIKSNSARMGIGFVTDNEIINLFQNSEDFKKLIYDTEINYLTTTNFELFDKKTFYISDNLVEHLAYTEIDTISEYVCPPFDCCLFVYTSPIAIKAFYKIQEKQEDIDLNSPISVFIVNMPSEQGERIIVFACWHANQWRTYSYVKRQLLIRKDWTIKQMLKTDWKDIYQENLEFSEFAVDEERVFYEDGLLFFRIVVNSIIYLSSNEPDIINCLSPRTAIKEEIKRYPYAKRKILKKEANSVTELDFASVGSTLGKIIVQKPQPPSDSSFSSSERRQLSARFIVRGHWRNQPHGEGNKQRKLIWIKPYYKGPDMADLINKPYDIR